MQRFFQHLLAFLLPLVGQGRAGPFTPSLTTAFVFARPLPLPCCCLLADNVLLLSSAPSLNNAHWSRRAPPFGGDGELRLVLRQENAAEGLKSNLFPVSAGAERCFMVEHTWRSSDGEMRRR